MPKKSPVKSFHALLSVLASLPDGLRERYTMFHIQHRALIEEMPASTKHHHAFVGGYAVHVDEVVTNLIGLVSAHPSNKFTYAQAVIAGYVHDLDKLFWRYERDPDKPTEAQLKYAQDLKINTVGLSKTTVSQLIDAKKSGRVIDVSEISQHTARPDYPFMDDSAAVATLMLEHNLPGWDRVIAEAVSLHHGGWAPVARSDIKHSAFPPLAVLLHSADLISAQIQNGEDQTVSNQQPK